MLVGGIKGEEEQSKCQLGGKRQTDLRADQSGEVQEGEHEDGSEVCGGLENVPKSVAWKDFGL